jgi:hypothetical protein
MGLDPTLVNGFRPTPIGPDIGTMMQNAQAMMQVDAAKQQMGRQNALRGILSQPGAIDDKGNPTPDVMKQVYGIDPQAGMALQQNMLVNQQRQLQTDMLKSKAFSDKMDLMSDAYAPIYETYQDEVKAGATPEQAGAHAQEGITAAYNRLKEGGALTPQEVQNLPTQWDPTKIGQFVQGSKNFQEWRSNQAKAAKDQRTEAREEESLKERERHDRAEEGRTDFGPVVQGIVTQDGKPVRVMAQQNRQTGEWVSADGDRRPLDKTFQIQKPPAAGSVAETRERFRDDLDADPEWKNRSNIDKDMEVESRIKIAQGTKSDPAAWDSLAEEIASYRTAPLSGFAKVRPGGPEVMARVMKLNPDYEEGRFQEVNRAMIEFVPGKKGDTIRSLNTAVQHLDVLDKAADALNNGNVALFNRLANTIAIEFGVPAPTNFNGLKQIVGTELQKAIGGGIGAESDRAQFGKALDASNSREALGAVINSFKLLMGGQARTLKQQYEDSTNFTSGPFAFEKKLLPETIQQLGLSSGESGKAGAGETAKPPPEVMTSAGGRWPEGTQIPPDAVKNLQQHPETADAFSRNFGVGATKQILGDKMPGEKKADTTPAKKDEGAKPQGAVEVPAARAKDPDGTTYNGGKFVKRGGYLVPLTAQDNAAAAKPGATQPKTAIPPRPARVPRGSVYSPSRQMWRDSTGRLYDADGNAFPAP